MRKLVSPAAGAPLLCSGADWLQFQPTKIAVMAANVSVSVFFIVELQSYAMSNPFDGAQSPQAYVRAGPGSGGWPRSDRAQFPRQRVPWRRALPWKSTP